MTIFKRAALAAVLVPAVMAGAAQAAQPGFFIGGSLGQTTIDQDAGDLGYSGNNTFKIDADDTAWKTYLGYNFSNWLGIEGGYVDFGSFSKTIRNDTVRVDPTGWDAFLVANLPVGPVDLFAKVGGISLKTSVDTQTFGSDDNSDGQLAYGVGAAYNVGHFAFRVEAEGFDNNEVDDFYVLSAGVTYSFGADKPAPAVVAAAPAVVAEPASCADADSDGVCDTDDQCPNTPQGTAVGSEGCSCHYTLQLEFAFDSATLSASDMAQLDELVPVLKNPKVNFIGGEIDGYTDSVGSEDYNLGLSKRRAQSVADYLESHGVSLTGRFATSGYGEADPVADNSTAEGRAQNRRVVVRRTDCKNAH